jgi:hypothetical protein
VDQVGDVLDADEHIHLVTEQVLECEEAGDCVEMLKGGK